jgi:Mg2+/Co2+ transporter CorC
MLEKFHRQVIESVHSFFPVGQDSVDNLLGVVQAKKFLAPNPTQLVELQAILQQPLYVPESIRFPYSYIPSHLLTGELIFD